MNQIPNDQLELFSGELDRLFAASPLRITLSCPKGSDVAYQKLVFKPSKYGFRLEKFTAKQVFHENLTAEDCKARVSEEYTGNYGELNAMTEGEALTVKLPKGGKLFITRKKNAAKPAAPQLAHNRAKNYIIRESDKSEAKRS